MRSSIVLFSTIALFIIHPLLSRIGLHLEAPAIAILGATVLMLLTIENNHQLEEVFARVEWTTIFFFAGLFILVGGIQEVGIIRFLAEKTITLTGGDIQTTATAVLWLSGIASATIDNIPFVATMIPLSTMLRQVSVCRRTARKSTSYGGRFHSELVLAETGR